MKKLSLILMSSAFIATLFISSCKSGGSDSSVPELAGKKADSLLSVQRADIMTNAQKDCDMMCMQKHDSMFAK